MTIEDRAKATARNLEGKAQSAMGEVTGDPEAKIEGERKQTEAEARHAVEDVKDKAKDLVDRV